jgi:halimadienyl-diphosphate synthase
MVINVLHRAGKPVDQLVPVLLSFERDDHFACFHVERDPSVTANARVLEVLSRDRRYRARTDKVVSFLADHRFGEGYWLDKWHISPYYATAHVVAAARSYAPELLVGTKDWLLATARPDGSWGWHCSTLEETAYGIFMLRHLAAADGKDPGVTDAIAAATRYLAEQTEAGRPPRYTPSVYPHLWVGKGLYTPIIYCHALVLAAMAIGQRLSQRLVSR